MARAVEIRLRALALRLIVKLYIKK